MIGKVFQLLIEKKEGRIEQHNWRFIALHGENPLIAGKRNRDNGNEVVFSNNTTALLMSLIYTSSPLGLDFPEDLKKVTLQHLSDVVVTWCHYQSDHWPKSGE